MQWPGLIAYGVQSLNHERTSSADAHNLRMLLELAEDLLAQGVGDLGVDAGVLDVLVTEVVGHVFNPAAGFQEMHGHGMAQGMHGMPLDPGRLSIIVK